MLGLGHNVEGFDSSVFSTFISNVWDQLTPLVTVMLCVPATSCVSPLSSTRPKGQVKNRKCYWQLRFAPSEIIKTRERCGTGKFTALLIASSTEWKTMSTSSARIVAASVTLTYIVSALVPAQCSRTQTWSSLNPSQRGREAFLHSTCTSCRVTLTLKSQESQPR